MSSSFTVVVTSKTSELLLTQRRKLTVLSDKLSNLDVRQGGGAGTAEPVKTPPKEHEPVKGSLVHHLLVCIVTDRSLFVEPVKTPPKAPEHPPKVPEHPPKAPEHPPKVPEHPPKVPAHPGKGQCLAASYATPAYALIRAHEDASKGS